MDAGAELLRRRNGRAVPTDPLRLAHGESHVGLDGDPAATPRDARETLVRSLPDELHVLARPEREALCRDVHGLEQVRLAGTVPPGDEDEPGLEREL